MNFTSNAKLGFVANGILTIAAATALIGWASHLILAPAPTVTMKEPFAKQDSIRTSNHPQIDHRGVELTQSSVLGTVDCPAVTAREFVALCAMDCQT